MKLKKIIRLGKLQKKQKEQNKIYIPPQTGNVRWQHIFLVNQSAIKKIYKPVILSALWALILKILYEVCGEDSWFVKNFFFPSSLVTYLGLVLSLLLVFRNNSAYDRYWEGRKAWAGILTNIRNISRNIWIGVEIDEDASDKKSLEQLNSKKGVMRLLIALVVSVKHTLRGEYGWDYDDLAELVQHVPRFNSLMSTAPTQVLKILPLEIAYHIQGYVYLQKNVPITLITPIYNGINSIIDSLTSCERILLTPIPIIYGIHIKHTLIFYIITLPLQLVQTCGWMTIVIVILTSFTLFGIEAISSEIENPFGSDNNDLKLEEFCQQIQDEINSMMKYFPSSISVVDWLECEDISDYSSVVVDVSEEEIQQPQLPPLDGKEHDVTEMKERDDTFYNKSRAFDSTLTLNEQQQQQQPTSTNPSTSQGTPEQKKKQLTNRNNRYTRTQGNRRNRYFDGGDHDAGDTGGADFGGDCGDCGGGGE